MLLRRLRRSACLFVLVVGSGFTLSAAGQSASAAAAGPTRITFADNRVSFTPPPTFTPLDSESLAAKFPRTGAPRHAIGNARRTTTIAYDQMDGPAPSDDLEKLRTVLLANFAPLPNLRWVASDVRSVGQHRWAYVEFTAAGADQELHNIVLLTVSAGRLVMFNFNSTVAEFPKVERGLRASIASIKVQS